MKQKGNFEQKNYINLCWLVELTVLFVDFNQHDCWRSSIDKHSFESFFSFYFNTTCLHKKTLATKI